MSKTKEKVVTTSSDNDSIYSYNRNLNNSNYYNPDLIEYLDKQNEVIDVKPYLKINEAFQKKKQLIFGFDTEFSSQEKDNDTFKGESEVYLYQLSFINDKGELVKFIYDNKANHYQRLDTNGFIQKVLISCLAQYMPSVLTEIEEWDVVLMSHYSVAEQSTISDIYQTAQNDEHLTALQFSKLVNIKLKDTVPFKSLSFKDTMNYDKSSLADIGECIGFRKVDLQTCLEEINPNIDYKGIEHFGWLLKDKRYIDIARIYAVKDAIICLLFTLGLSDLVFQEVGIAKIFETTPSATEFLFLHKYEPNRQSIKEELEDFGIKEISKEYRKQFYDFWEKLGHRKVHYLDKKGNPVYDHDLVVSIRAMGEQTYCGGRNQLYTAGEVRLPAFDLDLKSAYPIPLRLIKAIKFQYHSYTKKGVSYQQISAEQGKSYTFDEFKEYIKTLTDEEIITLQGTFKGNLVYRDNVRITPTVDESINGLCEVLASQHSHHIIELIALLKYPELVDWEQTEISNIQLLETTNEYVFREFVDYLIMKRSQFPKGHIMNALYKLLVNSFYGKLAQGVRIQYVNNVITDEKNKKPESNIFNPLFASYITAFVRLLTFEAVYRQMTYFEETKTIGYVLNVITDGCLIATKRIEDIRIDLWEKQYFSCVILTKALPQMKTLWEIKHINMGGTYIPKVRIDFPLKFEECPYLNDKQKPYPMKIAKPSCYSLKGKDELTITKQINELNRLRLNPTEPVPSRRLASVKDILESGEILYRMELKKIINWNIVSNKQVDDFIDDEYLKGCTLKLFVNSEQVTKNYIYLAKHTNEFIPTNDIEMMNLKMHQKQIELKMQITRNTSSKSDDYGKNSLFNKVINDIFYWVKRLNIKIKYNNTMNNYQAVVDRTKHYNFVKNSKSLRQHFYTPKMLEYVKEWLSWIGLDEENQNKVYDALKNQKFE